MYNYKRPYITYHHHIPDLPHFRSRSTHFRGWRRSNLAVTATLICSASSAICMSQASLHVSVSYTRHHCMSVYHTPGLSVFQWITRHHCISVHTVYHTLKYVYHTPDITVVQCIIHHTSLFNSVSYTRHHHYHTLAITVSYTQSLYRTRHTTPHHTTHSQHHTSFTIHIRAHG